MNAAARTYVFGETGESHTLASVESAQAMAMDMFKHYPADTSLPVYVKKMSYVGEFKTLAFTITNRKMLASLHILGTTPNDDRILENANYTGAVLALGIDQMYILGEVGPGYPELSAFLAELGEAVYVGGRCEADKDSLEAAVCDFFGVEAVTDVTDEAWDFAKNQHSGEEFELVDVTVTVKLQIRKPKALPLEDVINDLDYSFTSTTIGAVVKDTSITDYESQPNG